MVYREYLTIEIRKVKAKIGQIEDPVKRSLARSYLNRLMTSYREGVPKWGENSTQIRATRRK